MTRLDAALVDRLVKLAGMFGSHHEGERANAAAMADRLLRDHGLTWVDVISPKLPRAGSRSMTFHDKVAFLGSHLDLLDDWQRKFVVSVARYDSPTPKQARKVDELISIVMEMKAAA